jgi:hypothetical protein
MELTIDGISIQLGDSSPAITKKSIDPNKPTDRFIDFSNSFNLPDTEVTRKIFESPQAIGSDNRSHDKTYMATLSDIFKLFSGRGFLTRSSKNEMSFQIVDDSKDLFKALEVRLRNINWDDKDTILTQAAINALDVEDITTCWIWNKLCLHENALKINTDQTTGDARCKYSRPSFYLQGLLNRAISQQGYTLTAPTPGLAISACHSDFFFTSYQKTVDATFNPAGSLNFSGLDTNDFEHADLTVGSTSINIGTKKTKFRLRGSITSNAAITLSFAAIDNADANKITTSNLEIGIGTQEIDFTTSEFQSATGMTVYITFTGTGAVTIDALLYTLLSDRYEDLSANPFLDYKIKAYDNLPDISYLDIFKTICVLFNKYQIVNSFTKSFSFGSFANLNKNRAKDWTSKFIQGTETVTSAFSNLAQKNWLSYNNDKTVNPQLGWSFFYTDNESLDKEGEYIGLKYGASHDVNIDANKIAQLKVYTDTTRQVTQPINIRLFQVVSDKLQFTPIAWSALVAGYYSNFFNSLYRVRVIECEFNLKRFDVVTWHPNDLVFVDYFKSVFIVLAISNFIPGKKTKVKLLAYGR